LARSQSHSGSGWTAVSASTSKARAPGIARDRQHWRGLAALGHGFPTDLSTDSVDKFGLEIVNAPGVALCPGKSDLCGQ
jgi:hypothetical protein